MGQINSDQNKTEATNPRKKNIDSSESNKKFIKINFYLNSCESKFL